MQRIPQDQVGALLRVRLVDQDGKAVPLTEENETLQLVLEPPTGAPLTVTATVHGAAADGVLEYATTAGDLAKFGVWRVQPLVTRTNGAEPTPATVAVLRGLPVPFEVVAKLA